VHTRTCVVTCQTLTRVVGAQVPGGSGVVVVSVKVGNQADSTPVPVLFTYTPPSLANVTAASYPTAGNVVLTLVVRVFTPLSCSEVR
jgi:hypothetical protein